MTLDELAIKYGSDKSSLGHGYTKYYEYRLLTRPKRILEIGAMHGASLMMWQEYFPNAEIVTFDLFQNPDFASQEQIESIGVKTYKGDQGYIKDLSQIEGLFDIIIDDGSHRSDHQITSLKYLFTNALERGGSYIIEDLHCNKDEFFRAGLRWEDTILYKSQNGNLRSLVDYDASYLFEDKILFIYK